MSDNINGFPVPEEPETREEQYLSAIAQVTPATQIPPEPLTRVEAYLNKIVENGTGGGGGGTTNYNALENKPQINSHELSGNKSSSDLGLQAALTEAQQAAVDSGIDSTKVQQIETNKTNISLKANTSDVNTTTANLQSQINNIITPVTQEAEVQNARVGADGTSYQTLKLRLDAENAELTEEFDYIGTEVGIIRKRIRNANIDSSGIIGNGIYDLICYYCEFATEIQELTSDQTLVYAYYLNEPVMGSQSYNASRRISDSSTASNVPLPTYAKWTVIRCSKGGNVTVKYNEKRGLSKNNFTDVEKAKVDAIPESPKYTDTIYAPTGGQIIYNGDNKVSSGYIVNAVAYNDGVIIACRSDGTVVRIGYSGTEEILLTIDGNGTDWRCCYIDQYENVFVSPHASWGSMTMTERGLYKLEKGANAFTKVLSFDNTTPHDDTIWTMCEDNDGYMYAGTYCHLIRFQPRIYRSSDNGDTWEVIADFTNSPVISGGKHIHTIIYNKYQNALYTIVGEINTILKSTDNGATWENLNVALTVKGSAMLALPQGIVIGSDGAYNCDLDILYNDDKTHRKIYRGWANTVFAIRVSDITGFIYAFTKIDSSVNSTDYYPPITVLDGTTTIEEWQESVSTATFNSWKSYYDSVIEKYPNDAIRPQHYSILVSRDGGMTFDVLKAFETTSERANGIWTIGYFRNGECLCGCYDNGVKKPFIISEGKHKYVAGGCDLTGEIFIKTNTNSTISTI